MHAHKEKENPNLMDTRSYCFSCQCSPKALTEVVKKSQESERENAFNTLLEITSCQLLRCALSPVSPL